MLSKQMEPDDLQAIKKALRAKSRAEAELGMLMADLEEKYDFCRECDQIDVRKGVVVYARPGNIVEPVDSK